ncbi:MAG: helix-turn-helix domain-containing protein [Clostridia bacterium]|nr:helix-turn-helix domain-containing protein [Clostridia bacterium]
MRRRRARSSPCLSFSGRTPADPRFYFPAAQSAAETLIRCVFAAASKRPFEKGSITLDELRTQIINNLKRIIAVKGIRQKDIADALGVSQGSITNWLSGRNTPDLVTLIRLCRLLDVPLDTVAGSDVAGVPSEEIRRLVPLLSSLSPEELELTREFVSLLLKAQQKP